MEQNKQKQEQEEEENLEYDDKYSRLIGAIGKDALKKMQQGRILICGMKGLGIEIAKNVVLMGVKKCTIYDNETVQIRDLSSQFFLREDDVGKNRAKATHARLLELNDTCDLTVSEKLNDDLILKHTVVVYTNNKSLSELKRVSKLCHEKGIAFIASDTFGLYGYAFADFGEKHIVTDVSGEPPVEGYVMGFFVGEDKKGYITSQKRHKLEDGQIVRFEEIKGLEGINGKKFKVTTTSPFVFSIGIADDIKGNYVSGGMFVVQKQPKEFSYKQLDDLLSQPVAFDKVVLTDYAFFGENAQNVVFTQALLSFRENNDGNLPRSHNDEDAKAVVELAKKINEKVEKTELNEKLLERIAKQARGDLNCMAAFFGGVLAQEIIKAQSGKYLPLDQFLFFESVRNCLPEKELDAEEYKEEGTRYDGQICVFGKTMQKKIQNLKYFLVGAGAIGCEMLKNFAMIGMSTGEKGKLKIVDLDIIEISNLNRQFLYRQSDVKKPKAECSARAAKVMNPDMKIQTFTTKVCPDTEDTYDDQFWEELDGVCNALDNLKARLYVDSRCIFYGKSLLESGTLGTKGNTQVIVPHITQSYGESKDPEQEGVAKCLLHSFPSNIDMCLQWARELIFEGEFVSYCEAFNTYLKKEKYLESMNPIQLKRTLYNFKKILPLPKDFDECIVWARNQFQRYYNHDPKQLLFNYPLDHKDKRGTPFWTGTRRPPKALEFDPKDPSHANFVISAAFLRAYTTGILKSELKPEDFEKQKKHILDVASKVTYPPFKPSSKVKIATNVEEEKEHDEEVDDEELKELKELLPPRTAKPLIVCDFEKDDDRNFHIDFIHAAANLKAAAYGIRQVNRLKAKLIAGRIVPAIVTTTAAVAGLVIFELYKLLREGTKIEQYRNSFLTLALTIFQLTEPAAPRKYKWLGEEKTSWSLIKFKEGDITVKEFVKILKEKYKCDPFMINYILPNNSTKIIFDKYDDSNNPLDKKVSQLVKGWLKKDFAPTQKCFKLQVLPDADDDDDDNQEEEEMPPVWFYFK